jgi:hypothetical protein
MAYEEYLEYLRRNVSLLERLGDRLSGTDERVDYAVRQILSQQAKLDSLSVAVSNIAERLGVEVIVPERKVEQIKFSYTVQPLQAVKLIENAPFAGTIRQVVIHWPDGCNALVDVRVGHGNKQFCPNEGFLALNDATPSFDFEEPVDDHEEIWVEIANGDSAYEHSITATVSLEA